mgnify:FL=1
MRDMAKNALRNILRHLQPTMYEVKVYELQPKNLMEYIELPDADRSPLPEKLARLTNEERKEIAYGTAYAMISLTDRGLAMLPLGHESLTDDIRGKIFFLSVSRNGFPDDESVSVEDKEKSGGAAAAGHGAEKPRDDTIIELSLAFDDDGEPDAISSIPYPLEKPKLPENYGDLLVGTESTQLRFWYDNFGFLRVSTFKSIQIHRNTTIYGTSTNLFEFVEKKAQQDGLPKKIAQELTRLTLAEKENILRDFPEAKGKKERLEEMYDEIAEKKQEIREREAQIAKERKNLASQDTGSLISLERKLEALSQAFFLFLPHDGSLPAVPPHAVVEAMFRAFSRPKAFNAASWVACVDFMIRGMDAVGLQLKVVKFASSMALMMNTSEGPHFIPMWFSQGGAFPAPNIQASVSIVRGMVTRLAALIGSSRDQKGAELGDTRELIEELTELKRALRELRASEDDGGGEELKPHVPELFPNFFQCFIVQAQQRNGDEIMFLESRTFYRGNLSLPENGGSKKFGEGPADGEQADKREDSLSKHYTEKEIEAICTVAKSFFAIDLNFSTPDAYRMPPSEIEKLDRRYNGFVVTSTENNRTSVERFIANYLSSPSFNAKLEVDYITRQNAIYPRNGNDDALDNLIKVSPSLGDFGRIITAINASDKQTEGERRINFMGILKSTNTLEGDIATRKGGDEGFPKEIPSAGPWDFETVFRAFVFFLVAESLSNDDIYRAKNIAGLPMAYHTARINVGDVICDIIGSSGEGKIPVRRSQRGGIDRLLESGLLTRDGEFPSSSVSMAFIKTVVRIENSLVMMSAKYQPELEEKTDQWMADIADANAGNDALFEEMYWEGPPIPITVPETKRREVIESFLRKSKLSSIWTMLTTVQTFANKAGGIPVAVRPEPLPIFTGDGRRRGAGGGARAAGGAGGGARAAGGAARPTGRGAQPPRHPGSIRRVGPTAGRIVEMGS